MSFKKQNIQVTFFPQKGGKEFGRVKVRACFYIFYVCLASRNCLLSDTEQAEFSLSTMHLSVAKGIKKQTER